MNRSLLTAACVLALIGSTLNLRAQGSVAFANSSETTITNALTGQLIYGTNLFLFGLYAGPPGSTEPQLSLLRTAPNHASASPTEVSAGRFGGGIVNVPGGTSITPVVVQVRGWSQAAGSTYEIAYAAALAGDFGILLGKSGLALVYPSVGPGPPTQLFRPDGPLGGFSVAPIPEPSSGALAVLGAAALVGPLRRSCAGTGPALRRSQ